MRRFQFLSALFLSMLSTWAPAARGDVGVGDMPKLKFESANAKGPVDLESLKGKMVLVDFWATWCGPCMAEAGHMVAINDKYKDKGLVFIGISLDQDKAAMLATIKEKGFTWPQYFDGLVWQSKVGTAWGVKSIPATFLISPDGDVLWKGHPALIDPVLEKAMADHPPRTLDEKAFGAARVSLDQTEAALQAGKNDEALKAFAALPAGAAAEASLADRVTPVKKQLSKIADQKLADADAAAGQKQYGRAFALLKQVSQVAALDAAPKADQRLAQLRSDPAVKSEIEAAEKADRDRQRDAAAAEQLTSAQQLQSAGKDDDAYGAFKRVATDFKGTPSAASAAVQVKKYEQDPAFMKQLADHAAEAKASSALKLAASYHAAGRNDLARQKYQTVIDQFPGTVVADAAKKGLTELSE